MTSWTWEYDGQEPSGECLRESLCTLGNGYLATSGALPECAAHGVHHPGTCAAGCRTARCPWRRGRRAG